MNNLKTNTKIKNVLLAIVGIPMTIIMVSDLQEPRYWWVQMVAAAIVLIIIRIALGGKQNDRN